MRAPKPLACVAGGYKAGLHAYEERLPGPAHLLSKSSGQLSWHMLMVTLTGNEPMMTSVSACAPTPCKASRTGSPIGRARARTAPSADGGRPNPTSLKPTGTALALANEAQQPQENPHSPPPRPWSTSAWGQTGRAQIAVKHSRATWVPGRRARPHPGGVEDASAPKGSLTQPVGDADVHGNGANATALASS